MAYSSVWMSAPAVMVASMIGWIVVCRTLSSICRTMSPPRWIRPRAIAYEKFGRWFDAEEPLLRAKERTDAGSSPFRHPRSELIAPLLQEAPPAFNNRKLHMRLPWDGPAAPCKGQPDTGSRHRNRP